MTKRIWDNFLTERDKEVYAAAGYGKRGGFGTRPALIVIDVQYNFVGDEPKPILEAIKDYRTACGLEGWQAVPYIRSLVESCREKGFPIFYTVSDRRPDLLDSGVQVGKNYRGTEKSIVRGTHATDIVAEVAPRPQDILIHKVKPSAFFATPLMSHLNFLDIDTLIITGCTTSGCVRATTVDAYSYNFKAILPEGCIFDRGQASHAINLFDLSSKYADVIATEEVLNYLEGLPARQATPVAR